VPSIGETRGMHPTSLDHVALWVADRDPIAEFLTSHTDMHVIEKTDTFTLVGTNARRGKLTLFDAEGPRERGPLAHIALRVSDLGRALDQLPEGTDVEQPRDGEVYFDLPEGLRIGLVESPTDVEYDLDHVALFSDGPRDTALTYRTLGFRPAGDGP
jgi:catechol 2,3-dioxygenase-like lactoylglutathione lyase family enzyme